MSTAIVAAAEIGNSHTDSAAAIFTAIAEAAGVTGTELKVSFAAVAETRNSYTDSAAAFAAFFTQAACTPGVPVMMVAGSIDGSSNWVEASSLARAIEDAMVNAGVLKLNKESKATTKDRRKSFVAIATGLVNYLQQNMDILITKAKLHDATSASLEVPTADTTLSQAVK